jgi:hypothetical protein
VKTKLDERIFRQGDVMLVRVDELPAGLEDITPKAGRVVLLQGEATNHFHAFYDRGVQVYARDKKAARPEYLRVVETAYLKHEEHETAKLPPGLYRMPVQTEHQDSDEPIVVSD